jgi:hypothetical protein
MPNRPQVFRQHHVRRALKAAADAGVPDPAVRIRLPGGAELTVGSAAGMPGASVLQSRVPGKSDTAVARRGRPPVPNPRSVR